MLSTDVDLEITKLSAPERATREHTLDRETNHICGVALTDFVSGRALEAADVSSVTVVDLVAPLLTGERDLLCVDDDDVVTIVDVRGECGLVLATEDMSDL